jgi:DNA-binding NarL/FixJ family response regulator
MINELIKIAIADDHKIFRDGIKMALGSRDTLKMIWEAEDGKEMMHKMEVKTPDVLLMDIRMPEVDGINALQILRKEYGAVKIIVLTMYDDEKMVNKMMEMGANAYLTKTTDPAEIYQAIITCINEGFYFNDLVNKAVMGKLIQKKNVRQNNVGEIPVSFNDKEIKIIQLLAEDMTTDEISKVVYLSPRTIETIRQNLKTRANVKTIAGLVMFAMRKGFIQ